MKISCSRLAGLVLCLCLSLATGGGAEKQAVRETDAFIEGYATAILEREFKLHDGHVRVRSGVVTVTASDLGSAERERLVRVLSAIRGVQDVEVVLPPPPPEEADATEVSTPKHQMLPREQLFEPLLADPRWPHMAVSYQNFGGYDVVRHGGAVNIGETLTLYRKRRANGSDWEIGLQPGVFALFNLRKLSDPRAQLLNVDFSVAGTWAYRRAADSALLRFIHQSSHLGDEFLLSRPNFNRINLSYDAVDLLLARDLGDHTIRVYGGGRYKLGVDPNNLDRWSAQYGAEWKSPRTSSNGKIRPLAALDVQHQQELGWNPDISLRAGIQIENPAWNGHRVQLLAEYYNGHSPNGQFFRDSVDHLGVGIHFYY